SFAIEKASQSITFADLAGKTFGDPDFTVSASASSGLDAGFAANGSCTVSGATVHIASGGTCSITASQPGDGNYNPADSVTRSFSIGREAQTISFASLENKVFGDADFGISATASSGL